MFQELTGPLQGWTYDEDGTIYTASGYRCSAASIEAALWLFEANALTLGRRPIFSDEFVGARRPFYETNDIQSGSAGRKPDTLSSDELLNCVDPQRSNNSRKRHRRGSTPPPRSKPVRTEHRRIVTASHTRSAAR